MAKILVIDDEDDVRAVVRGVLESAGHDVRVASNGTRGLEALRMASVELVITDILMPEREGIETIRDIRQEFPAVRIIAMSGGGRRLKSTTHFLTASALGAHAVLSKPFGPEVLLNAVDAALTGE
jgi:CheY-like chemotaxis protein